MELKIIPIAVREYFTSNPKLKTSAVKEKFIPIIYEKQSSVEDAKRFALKKFGIEELQANTLSEYNRVNAVCTRIFNITNGDAKFTRKIDVRKNHGRIRYDGEYGDNEIAVIGTPYFEQTLIHELAHFNHELSSPNFEKMGKRSEIKANMFYPDYTYLERFLADSKNLRLARKFLGSYATPSPDEFVAEMFTAILNGKPLPAELFRMYKDYEGPFAETLFEHYKLANKLL